jgi:hypothetical protein
VVKFTDIDGEFAVFAGARGGWIINHTFVIGAGGYGLASDVGGEFPFNRAVEFGYGGLELEYIYRSDELVHISIYTLVGGGGVVEVFNNDLTDTVFVLEPAANVELNVAHFFRFLVGAGYRFVAGADFSFENEDLSAFVGTVTLKFGSF